METTHTYRPTGIPTDRHPQGTQVGDSYKYPAVLLFLLIATAAVLSYVYVILWVEAGEHVKEKKRHPNTHLRDPDGGRGVLIAMHHAYP